MVSAARAAKPPLSPSRAAGAHPGLLLVFGGQDAVADGQTASSTDRSIRARAQFIGDDVEMIGLAADDGAQRDKAVIVGAAFLGAVEREGNHRRDFQRARHGDDVIGRARLVERGLGAVEQRVGEIVVEARLDDKKMGLLLRANERFAVLGCASHGCLRVAGDLGRSRFDRKRKMAAIANSLSILARVPKAQH